MEIKGDVDDFLAGPLAGELAGMAGGRVIVRARRAHAPATGCAAALSSSKATPAKISAHASSPARSWFSARPRGASSYLNKRGSIVLARGGCFGSTYVDCGARELTSRGFSHALFRDHRTAAELLSRKLRRYGGDTAVYGKGETY